MFTLKTGTPLRLLPVSGALLCSVANATTGDIHYESYCFFWQSPSSTQITFQKYVNNPAKPGSPQDIEPMIWGRVHAECYGHATRLYVAKSEVLQEIYEMHPGNATHLIFWMGLAPDAFHRIEKTTKCQDLNLQLAALRTFMEEHREPYAPFH